MNKHPREESPESQESPSTGIESTTGSAGETGEIGETGQTTQTRRRIRTRSWTRTTRAVRPRRDFPDSGPGGDLRDVRSPLNGMLDDQYGFRLEDMAVMMTPSRTDGMTDDSPPVTSAVAVVLSAVSNTDTEESSAPPSLYSKPNSIGKREWCQVYLHFVISTCT